MKPDTYTALFSVAQPLAASSGPPEWLHLVPAGTFSGVDGRGPFELDDPEGVIRASMSQGRKLPIDENHAIDHVGPKGGATPARAWIVELQSRADGIWGRVEWTGKGRQLMEDRAYGFISPCLFVSLTKPHRVLQIGRASLVNDPNLLTLKALHAAEKGLSMTDDEVWSALRTELGLAADADGAAILQAVKDLGKNLNSADPAKFVAVELFQTAVAELNRVKADTGRQSAEQAVGAAMTAGKIVPAQKGAAIELFMTNQPLFESFVAGLPSLHAGGISPERARQLNSRAGTDAPQDEISKQLGLSADDVKKYGSNDR